MGLFKEPEEEIASLKKQVKEQQEAIVELNEVNVQLQDKIEEQELLLSKNSDKSLPAVKAKPVIPGKTFKVNGEEYAFIVPQFSNPLSGHSKITAEEAMTDTKLLEYLVANNCGVTKKII